VHREDRRAQTAPAWRMRATRARATASIATAAARESANVVR
jgi:hypothetical protein